jgi:hypothetical protein
MMGIKWLIIGIILSFGILGVYLLVKRGSERYNFSRSYDGHVFDNRNRRY